jgi:hypothetical protein
VFEVQGAPAFDPPTQRRPPQTPGFPPLIGQSAFAPQGSAFTLLHVSQRHRGPVTPVHAGLAADTVRVDVPVDTEMGDVLRAMLPTKFPTSGGQSKLVRP